jgi:hypothetical protein
MTVVAVKRCRAVPDRRSQSTGITVVAAGRLTRAAGVINLRNVKSDTKVLVAVRRTELVVVSYRVTTLADGLVSFYGH